MKNLKVLFICIHNSARSQMAEAFLNLIGEDNFIAESAGSEPAELNPLAVQVMKEIGIDISHKETKEIFDLFKSGKMYKFVITVCDVSSGERSPIYPGVCTRLQWSFKDPLYFEGTHEEKLEQTRKVRDQIKAKVEDFIVNHKLDFKETVSIEHW